MAFIFTDSFDHYDTVTQKWASIDTVGQAGNQTWSILAGAGRGNTSALYLKVDENFNATGRYGVRTIRALGSTTALTHAYIGFAFKSDNLNQNRAICRYWDGSSNQLTLTVRADGTLRVYRGSMTGTILKTSGIGLLANNFYFIEFEAAISTTTGEILVRVNGTPVISGTGLNTDNATTGIVTALSLENNVDTNAIHDARSHYFDDVYFNDEELVGDISIESLLPSAAGSTTGWAPSTLTNYECVDESAPNGDTDFISSSTVSTIDTYTFPTINESTSVLCVSAHFWAKKPDAGNSVIAPSVYQSGSYYTGPDAALLPGVDYGYASSYMNLNPATTNSWLASEINNDKFGIIKVS